VRARRRFVLSSHSRPDGDSIGSQLAMVYALQEMGKEATAVNADPASPPLMAFPGVRDIRIAASVEGDFDAAIIMECGDLKRTGVSGLERYFVINIDHHPGNTGYGQINWFDASAAACAEMVYDVVRALGVPLTREIATHVYLAILTDTGSFHHSHISSRTFDICRRCVDAGVDPAVIASTIYDSNHLGRLRLFGTILSRMALDPSGRVATLTIDRALTHETGGTYEDTEGLINFPLTVQEIQVVVFFKEHGPDDWRVSMRSKGAVNVNAIAREFGGGGHKNASGCSATGRLEELKRRFERRLVNQIDAASPESASADAPHSDQPQPAEETTG
jgi:phosphoesterase RecJ-like protein